MFDSDPRDRDNDDPRDVEAHWITLGRGSAEEHARDPFDDVRDRGQDARHRDPRDLFVDRLELPRGPDREVVVDGRHRYELNGEDVRTLAAVGAFRVVPESDLRGGGPSSDPRGPDLRHLRDEGLVRIVALDGRERGVALTERGEHLLDSHRRDGDDAREQVFHAGVSRPRELSHDAQLYRAYLREEERLREQGGDVRRVVLDHDLKREYQEWLQEHNRGRADSDGRRKRAPVSSRTAAGRWAEGRERTLFERLMKPVQNTPAKEVPTLEAFAPRFLDGHARANRQKPSGIAAKEMILRVHLVPALGHKKLDAIKSEDVQHLKSALSTKATKTVNNILTVLNVLLKKAVEWEVIERVPCTIRVLPVSKGSTHFYDFDEFERLVTAARATDPRAYLLVLMAGEAGLRLGEMVALRWGDIDLVKRQVCIQRSAWKGQTASPKGGRLRYIPLTTRLAMALRDHRHMRGPLVLYQPDGSPLTEGQVQGYVRRAAQKAGLFNNGPHMLRHTFCSHLAMRGAPARAIQELAGHQNLTTTQRYMHLSPAALDGAIRLLERPECVKFRGDILETGDRENAKANV